LFNPPENLPAAAPREAPAIDPVQTLVDFIADGINHGAKPSDIRRSLVARGVNDAEATRLVQQVTHAMAGQAPPPEPAQASPGARLGKMKLSKRALRKQKQVQTKGKLSSEDEMLQTIGQRNMLIGGLIFAAGAVVTLGSFAAASGAGGGTYLVASGAIFWGAVQFFRGQSQVRANRK
jgi:hypothetical protein